MQHNDIQEFFQFTDKIGYDVGKDLADNIEVRYQQSFDFFPDLAMFVAAYAVTNTFTRQTIAPKFIKNSICFFFKNVFDDASSKTEKQGLVYDKPCIRVFPSTFSYISHFKKGSNVKIISVLISADYLKSFLGNDVEQFRFLFDERNDFLVEEIMTDDIVRTINEIVKKEAADTLKDYRYKLKAMELLFYLFESLGRREKSVYQKLNQKDISSAYKVRDKIVSSLDKPTAIAELKQIAGMNELKMRKVFTQIFGMGIYDYYQCARMKEAARLIRDEQLSVSETGFKMGFENLSHFSRVFEKYIGKKPKKYSSEV